MGEGTINSGNEETTSKYKLKKNIDKKNVKNGNKITKKTKQEKFGDSGNELGCDLAYGDHACNQTFHGLLEELIRTRESFIRTDDIYVFPTSVTNRRKRNDSDETAESQRLSPVSVTNRRKRNDSDETAESQRLSPVSVTNRRKRNDSDETAESQRLSPVSVTNRWKRNDSDETAESQRLSPVSVTNRWQRNGSDATAESQRLSPVSVTNRWKRNDSDETAESQQLSSVSETNKWRRNGSDVGNRRKRNDSNEEVENQRVSRARSILADATEWSHLGRSTLVFKGGGNQKEDKVFHEDTSDYVVASTVTKSGELTPEQVELLKKAQSRELASHTSTTTTTVKKKKKKKQVVLIEMSKEASGGNKTGENDNVCVKLIGNIKKFCSCLPENLEKPSDTDQCKRKPKKVETNESMKQDSAKENPTEAFALFDLQTSTFGQLARETGKTTGDDKNVPSNGTNNNVIKKGAQSATKNKNNRRASLKCSRLRYNANSNNGNNDKLKCSVRLTGKDKGDLLVTGEDGKTHTLSFKINRDFNVVPDS